MPRCLLPFFALSVAACLPSPVSAEDWPHFLGPTRDSKSTEVGIRKDWADGGLPILWYRSTGIGYGIGSISHGRLYQYDRFDDHARLSCLEAKTGKLVWKFEHATDYRDFYGYNNGPRCSPVIDGDRVYILGAEGMLHCVGTDGKLVWKVDTTKEFGVVQNFFGVGSTPVIEGDLLICMIGGSPEEDQDTGPGQLDLLDGNGSGIVAFDKHTGEVKYKATDELASYATLQLATIGERRWGFSFARGGLVGFDPATGKVDFHYPWRAKILESVNASTPVVVGDEVFISETYGPGSSLLKVSPSDDPIVVWKDGDIRDKAMQTHWNTAIHHDNYIYGSSGRHTSNAELRCIDWKTGKVRWNKPGLSRCSLMYVDGHFVCLGEDGVLRLIEATPKEYTEVTQVTLIDQKGRPDPFNGRKPQLLKPPCWAAPILSDGRLYVRGADKLVCLELIPPK